MKHFDPEVAAAVEHFGKLLENQIERVGRLKQAESWADSSQISPIMIGVIGGDGIGPYITDEARRILEKLLAEPVRSGRVEFRSIEGLTIENRARHRMSVPDEVMEQIRGHHVLLKGPTHTPERGDPWPDLESANVLIRKNLDLFANIRPVCIPREGIDWTFFRENTEDLYAVGSQGLEVTPGLAVDFRIITTPGTERIVEAAFDFARRTGKRRVSVVTKANVVKTTDGLFLSVAQDIARR